MGVAQAWSDQRRHCPDVGLSGIHVVRSRCLAPSNGDAGDTCCAAASPPGAIPRTRRGSSPVVTAPPSRVPSQALSPTATSAGDLESWIPVSLPTEWASAGLTLGDALLVERTATTVTDREMSLDDHAVGTRAQQGGMLTARMFLLAPAARERFQQQGVRVTTNQLIELVVDERLIQAVVNPQPRLMAFAVRGQQPFAWVEVRGALWQSLTDPQTGQSQQGLRMNLARHQPRMHSRGVLLIQVPPPAREPMPQGVGHGPIVQPAEGERAQAGKAGCRQWPATTQPVEPLHPFTHPSISQRGSGEPAHRANQPSQGAVSSSPATTGSPLSSETKETPARTDDGPPSLPRVQGSDP